MAGNRFLQFGDINQDNKRVLSPPYVSPLSAPQPLTAFWSLDVWFKALPTLPLWGWGFFSGICVVKTPV